MSKIRTIDNSAKASKRCTIDLDSVVDELADRVVAKLEQRLAGGHAMTPQRLLSVEQAAEYLGRSKASVQHMVASAKIQVVRADRRVFLDVRDLDAWIEQNKHEAVTY